MINPTKLVIKSHYNDILQISASFVLGSGDLGGKI
jgi:hypothetical protein